MYLWFLLESCQGAEEQLGKCCVDWPKVLKFIVYKNVNNNPCPLFLSHLRLPHHFWGNIFLDFHCCSYFTLWNAAGKWCRSITAFLCLHFFFFVGWTTALSPLKLRKCVNCLPTLPCDDGVTMQALNRGESFIHENVASFHINNLTNNTQKQRSSAASTNAGTLFPPSPQGKKTTWRMHDRINDKMKDNQYVTSFMWKSLACLAAWLYDDISTITRRTGQNCVQMFTSPCGW